MNKNKILIAILFLMLSFGLCTQSLAQNYSDLQVKTTQSAIKRKAIYPSKYGLDSEASTKTSKAKKQTLGDLFMTMIKSLILVVALFLGIAALIAKHKDKFKNIKLPNALKNVPTEEEKQKPKAPEQTQQNPASELDSRDTNIRKSVFKFFEINK